MPGTPQSASLTGTSERKVRVIGRLLSAGGLLTILVAGAHELHGVSEQLQTSADAPVLMCPGLSFEPTRYEDPGALRQMLRQRLRTLTEDRAPHPFGVIAPVAALVSPPAVGGDIESKEWRTVR